MHWKEDGFGELAWNKNGRETSDEAFDIFVMFSRGDGLKMNGKLKVLNKKIQNLKAL